MGGEGAPKRNVLLGKILADPRSKFCLPPLKYQLKNKYPALAKNVTKSSVVTHVLF
jgi:hypothetical protein